jgi:hypothetical protein
VRLAINIKNVFCRASLIFVLLVLSVSLPSYAQDAGGVLVAAKSSRIQKTDILEIRRIYLGLPSSSDSLIRKAAINFADKKTFKDFLKNVMHMTEKGYRRKLIKRIFRLGSGKIIEIENIEKLVRYLKENPNDISFMDKDTAEKTKGIKVVQVLW